jgi:hypothetical protein
MKYAAVLAALLCTTLTACSGAGAGVPTASSAQSGAAGSRAHKGSVHFTIKVPKRPPHRRGERYVSSGTQSVSISLAPVGGGNAVVQNANVAGGSIDVSVALSAGSYVASVSAFAGTNESGAVLSSGQSLPVTIVADQANHVSVVLGGIPHAISIVPSAGVGGTQTAGFTLYGSASATMTVIAVDAAGFDIFGPGTPAFTASVASGAGWKVTANTVADSLTGLMISGPSASSSATIKVSIADPTLCSQAGSGCSTTFPVHNIVEKLYATVCEAGCAIGTAPDEIAIFAPPYSGQPVATITSGVNVPIDVAADASGNVFVLNCPECEALNGAPSITEYSTSNNYASPVATITTGLDFPERIYVDASDDIIVDNCQSCGQHGLGVDYVTVFTAPAYAASVNLTKNLGSIADLVVAPNGTIVVASCNNTCSKNGTDSLWQFAPPYSAATDPSPIAANNPQALTIDPSGNLWKGECAPCNVNDAVEEYAPDPTNPGFFGAPVVAATQADGVNWPLALAVDAKAALFVTNSYQGSTPGLNEYAAPPYSTPVQLAAGSEDPGELAVDAGETLFMQYGRAVTGFAVAPYATFKTLVSQDGTGIVYGQGHRFALVQ